MKFLSFTINNFKGVRKTSLQLAEGAPGRVVTLIGLNESGKTTILEALSNFLSFDTDTQTLVETVYAKVDPKTFIPKDKRGRFTDVVSIKAMVQLDDSDREAVRKKLLSTHNVRLTASSLTEPITVHKTFTFSDSKLEKQNKVWGIDYRFTRGTGSKVYTIASPPDQIWHDTVGVLSARLPEMVYFPTFLFDIPDRIYLSDIDGDTIKNSYYRKVLQNVLKAVDPEYSVNRHILDRVSAVLQEHGASGLNVPEYTEDVESVVRGMSAEINRVIIGAWKDILEKSVLGLQIELRWGVDQQKENAVFVEPYIIERNQYRYQLKERSLGFRWFFSFLLFTQFRKLGSGERGTVFLFDEPASHLHPSAQTELLSSFEKIMSDRDYVMYSTHSHYLINPLWLEKSYIIKNDATELPEAETAPFANIPNDIVAAKYKTFVSEHPTRVMYFQPVLDALKVKLGPLNLAGPAVIVEGKFDYHPFLFLKKLYAPDDDLKVFPAVGAGEMGVLSALFRGWNIPFVIILDADKQGKLESARYKKNYLLTSDQLFTLDQSDSALDRKSFEGIYQQDTSDLIKLNGLDATGEAKSQASALFQLLLGTGAANVELKDTVEVFATVYDHAKSCLASQGAMLASA